MSPQAVNPNTREKLAICERLRAPAYWMSGSSDGHEGENDAPREAAATIEALYEALTKAEAIMSSARTEINRLRAVAKLPAQEPAALNVAVYDAKTALSRARNEQVTK